MRWSKLRPWSVVMLAAATLAAACGSSSTEVSAGSSTPSQSPADAARDGVVADLAALPMEARVEVTASVRTEEGVWATSRPPESISEYIGDEDCRIGDETGKYPEEVICTIEYGELLLLDADQAEIVRAFPLPSVPAEFLEVGEDAVYCARNGEDMLRDSMVCRVDRSTLDAVVRIFPSDAGSTVVQPCFYAPDNWTVADENLDVAEVVVDSDGVWILSSTGRWTGLDPDTLEIIHRGLESPGAPSPTSTTSVPVPSTTAEPDEADAPETTTPPETAAPPETTAPPATTAPPDTNVLSLGSSGDTVTALQERLLELGYWLPAASGTFDNETLHAVRALQKVAGLTIDGAVGSATRTVLDDGIRPSPRSVSGRVIEIDLAHQVLLIVQDGVVEGIFDTSTGRPGFDTPPGEYTIHTEVDGWHDAGLGAVYRPKYFHEGLSIHAYPEVPSYPASHGCARVIYPAIDWLWDHGNVPVGTPVWVY